VAVDLLDQSAIAGGQVLGEGEQPLHTVSMVADGVAGVIGDVLQVGQEGSPSKSGRTGGGVSRLSLSAVDFGLAACLVFPREFNGHFTRPTPVFKFY